MSINESFTFLEIFQALKLNMKKSKGFVSAQRNWSHKNLQHYLIKKKKRCIRQQAHFASIIFHISENNFRNTMQGIGISVKIYGKIVFFPLHLYTSYQKSSSMLLKIHYCHSLALSSNMAFIFIHRYHYNSLI